MFDLLNLNPGTFGLDISDLSLKLVALRKKGSSARFLACNKASLPQGIIQKGEIKDVEKLVKAIKKLISKSRAIGTRHVIASLPEEKSFLRLLKMPKMSKKEIKEAVRFEAENYIPFSIEKVYLDSQLITPTTGQTDYSEVMLAALPKKIVDPYIEVFYKAGLLPVALETESLATARALIKEQITNKPIFIVDIGATCTNFSVFFDRSLRFTSFIPTSSNKFTAAVAENLKIEFQEAEKLKILYGLQKAGRRGQKIYEILLPLLTEFVWQIKKHIDYYQTHAEYEEILRDGKQVEKLLLCGGGAMLKGLIKFLSEELGLVVQKGNPLINLPFEEKRSKRAERDRLLPFATAIGLALRDIELGN